MEYMQIEINIHETFHIRIITEPFLLFETINDIVEIQTNMNVDKLKQWNMFII